MRLWTSFVIAFAIVPAATSARAEVKPAAMFSNHAVLQRDMKVPVWGTADPGEKVAVKFNGQTAETAAGTDGAWCVDLEPMKAGGPFELAINDKTFTDVMVGEVWYCTGQSNMHWELSGTPGFREKVKDYTKFPNLRMYNASGDKTLPELFNRWGTSEEAAVTWRFSAVGFFFGRDIGQALDVPVGMVYGGIHHPKLAISPEGFATDPALKPFLRPGDTDASSTFKSVVARILPYAVRGVLYYQGEANTGHAGRPQQYAQIFGALIRDWRKQWANPDMPFVFVQLPNYIALRDAKPDPETAQVLGGFDWPLLREAQLKVSQSVPHTAMAVAIDVGEAKNLHPPNKEPVGQRCALAALASVYGKAVVGSGPVYDTMKVEDGKVRITFRHVGGGLVAKAGPLKGFQVAGEDKAFVWADAKIDGDSVFVWSEKVPKPVAVRYAFWDNPIVSLYNKEGLPASPFRTDNWPAGGK